MQKKKGPPKPESPSKIIIEKLNFDDGQIIAYEKLIDLHREEVHENDARINELKMELYSLLVSDTDKAKIDSIATEIGQVQKEVEIIHYKHFHDIKAICKPEQIERFNELVKQFETIFNKKKHPRRPH